jgi:hypothetical protein
MQTACRLKRHPQLMMEAGGHAGPERDTGVMNDRDRANCSTLQRLKEVVVRVHQAGNDDVPAGFEHGVAASDRIPPARPAP